MPKPLSPNRLGNLKRRIKDRYVQGCGEQRIGYHVEVLDTLAEWAAEVALEERIRNGPVQQPAPVASSPLPAPPPLPFGMTPQLLELLELISERLTDRQVAVRLGVAERVVKQRLRVLYGALGCSGRFESVVTGYEAGLLGPDARSARAAAVRASVARSAPPAGSGTRTVSQAATGAAEAVGRVQP